MAVIVLPPVVVITSQYLSTKSGPNTAGTALTFIVPVVALIAVMLIGE